MITIDLDNNTFSAPDMKTGSESIVCKRCGRKAILINIQAIRGLEIFSIATKG